MDELNRSLVDLTRALARTDPSQTIAVRLCLSFCELMAAQGGSITMGLDPQKRVVLCATDATAVRIEDAHQVLGDGPCLDVASTGVPVTGLTLEQQRERWPMFFELLERNGPPSFVQAFALKPQSGPLGTVCVHQDASARHDVSPEDAQLLANAIGVALVRDFEESDVSDEQWSYRDRIDHATGMVIAQLHLAPDDALAVLRAHAFAHATTLGQVSDWVLDRRLTFADPHNKDGSSHD